MLILLSLVLILLLIWEGPSPAPTSSEWDFFLLSLNNQSKSSYCTEDIRAPEIKLARLQDFAVVLHVHKDLEWLGQPDGCGGCLALATTLDITLKDNTVQPHGQVASLGNAGLELSIPQDGAFYTMRVVKHQDGCPERWWALHLWYSKLSWSSPEQLPQLKARG